MTYGKDIKQAYINGMNAMSEAVIKDDEDEEKDSTGATWCIDDQFSLRSRNKLRAEQRLIANKLITKENNK